MTPGVRWAVVGVLLVAFGVAVVVAGRDSAPSPALPGVERLGPDPGEAVPAYLTRAATTLPHRRDGPVWALVQLRDYADADAAARLAGDARIARVVLRVPLPRVQTALVERAVPGQRPAAELATAMREAADARAGSAANAPAGSRPAAVAAAEAQRLRAGCRCVLALLVHADRTALDGLSVRQQVRVVHAAAPGTPPVGVALAPLLPEQVDVAGPVPDDGPVPGTR